MTAVEIAVYAAETRLLIKIVVGLAAIFFAAALMFAFFFGSVQPRLRGSARRNKRLRMENAALRASGQKMKAELGDGAAKIIGLEKQVDVLDKEVRRLDGIRKRTDSSLVETKALLERLQTVTAHVDVP